MTSVKEKHREWLRDFYKKSSEIITVRDDEFILGISRATQFGFLSTVDYTGRNKDGLRGFLFLDWKDVKKIINGSFSAFGLKYDGTVLALGESTSISSEPSDLNVSSWTDIVDIAKAEYATIGLKKDGTVVAAGSNYYGECDVSGFSSIVQIIAGEGFTAGLRADGKVEFAGVDKKWQERHQNRRPTIVYDLTKINYYYDTSSWTDIVKLYALSGIERKCNTIVGLKRDGKVLLTGDPDGYYSELASWSEIVDIIGNRRVVGIKKDGSEVVLSDQKQLFSDAGVNPFDGNIASTSGLCGGDLVLLKNDGTVMAAGFDSEQLQVLRSWKNIVAIYNPYKTVIGLKANGETLQTSYDPIESFNSDKQLEDLNNGIVKEVDEYTESYTIDTKYWGLQSMDLDAYVLAVRMMLEDDDELPEGLLQTIDYFANARELIDCLKNISDKSSISRVAVDGAKKIHDIYHLDDIRFYNTNKTAYRKIKELLTLLAGYNGAQKYLTYIKEERIKIKAEFKQTIGALIKKHKSLSKQIDSLQEELDGLSEFSIFKKMDLQRKIKRLEQQHHEVHLEYSKALE